MTLMFTYLKRMFLEQNPSFDQESQATPSAMGIKAWANRIAEIFKHCQDRMTYYCHIVESGLGQFKGELPKEVEDLLKVSVKLVELFPEFLKGVNQARDKISQLTESQLNPGETLVVDESSCFSDYPFGNYAVADQDSSSIGDPRCNFDVIN